MAGLAHSWYYADEEERDHSMMQTSHRYAECSSTRGRERQPRLLSTLLAVIVAVVLAVAGCAGGDTTTNTAATTNTVSTTNTVAAAETTATISQAVAGVQELLDSQVGSVIGPDREGALMVAVVDSEGSIRFAAEGSDPQGNAPTFQAAFRIGSLTKMFTSAVVLQLVDEGLVDLDAPVSDYVTRLSTPEGVTVRNLLQHTSGIPNYTEDPDILSRGFADPDRVWTPVETYSLIVGRDLLFDPGTRFSYSNTNYLVVGVLIEEVTGLAYSEVLRARVLDPLGLSSTYLAGFQDGPEPFPAYTRIDGRLAPIDFPYTAIATDAWTAGGLVSTVGDLATFMGALFDGRLISRESISAMTEDLRDDYGLGIIKFSEFGEVYGHGGGIPGYGTLVMHAPETGSTAVWVVTNDEIDISRTVQPVADHIARP